MKKVTLSQLSKVAYKTLQHIAALEDAGTPAERGTPSTVVLNLARQELIDDDGHGHWVTTALYRMLIVERRGRRAAQKARLEAEARKNPADRDDKKE